VGPQRVSFFALDELRLNILVSRNGKENTISYEEIDAATFKKIKS
jgi:hypothetical protein